MPTVFCVDWSEDDEELGAREDGWSLHLTREDALAYIARRQSRYYGHSSPHLVRVPKDVVAELQGSRDGLYYPRPAECPYPTVSETGTTERRGWSAMPRLTLWLCVPALVSGLAGLASVLAPGPALTAAQRGEAVTASEVAAFVFGALGMLLTPVAAALCLVITVLRKWQGRVVAVLWAGLLIAAASIWPALGAAVKSLLLLMAAG